MKWFWCILVCIYAIYKSECFHNVEAILSDILDLEHSASTVTGVT